jgi:hypothetical protein
LLLPEAACCREPARWAPGTSVLVVCRNIHQAAAWVQT